MIIILFSNKSRTLFIIPILIILAILVASYWFIKPEKIVTDFNNRVNNSKELSISSSMTIKNDSGTDQDLISQVLSDYSIKLDSYYNKEKNQNFINLTMGTRDRVLMYIKAFYEDNYIYLKSNKLDNTYKLNIKDIGDINNTKDLLFDFSSYDIVGSGYEKINIKRKYKEFKLWSRTIKLASNTDTGSSTIKIYYVPFIGVYKIEHMLTIDKVTFHIESQLRDKINIDISQIDKEAALEFNGIEDIFSVLY